MHRSTHTGRKLRTKRLRAGLCIGCSEPNSAQTQRCEQCLKTATKTAMTRYNYRRRKGLCISCGKEAVINKTRCTSCAITYRVRLLPKSERSDALKALRKFRNRCQICGTKKPGGKGQWHLDHNHKTGRFRGILCACCNGALGFSKERILVLYKLIRYLRLDKKTSKYS